MSGKRTLWLIVAVIVAVVALFDISVNLQFSLPGESEEEDVRQEARFEACYEERDAEIHHTAFGTIDNPDVQKEFINTNRAIATADCRKLYPLQKITVTTPFRLNLLDFDPRYW